jgi:hypothetical protein
MAHISFFEVQVSHAQNTSSKELSQQSRLVSIGVLGCDEYYVIPRIVLTTIAHKFNGKIAEDLPPFLVCCADGFVLVLTMSSGNEFFGTAVCLPVGRLLSFDPSLLRLWKRLNKDEKTMDVFFADTGFAKAGATDEQHGNQLESAWRSAFN